MQTLLSVNQAAVILKVHPLTIRRYIKEQRLKAVKIGGNIRIDEHELQVFQKEFVPQADQSPRIFRKRINAAKQFEETDPVLQLQGVGASQKVS